MGILLVPSTYPPKTPQGVAFQGRLAPFTFLEARVTFVLVIAVVGCAMILRAVLLDDTQVSRAFKLGVGLPALALLLTTLTRYDSPAGALIALPGTVAAGAFVAFMAGQLTEDWRGPTLKRVALAGLALVFVAAMLPKQH